MEIWKKVENFEDYEISSWGRLRCGNLYLKYFDNGLGYLVVRLRNNKERKRFYVHRLAMITFRPVVGKFEVNHKDHNKKNNEISNLEWVTHKENLNKAVQFLGKEAFRPKPVTI